MNNKKNGNGILYFSNGDKRVGVWKDDKLHGQATYYYSGGRIDEEVRGVRDIFLVTIYYF